MALALRLYTQEFSLGLSYDEMFSWNIAKNIYFKEFGLIAMARKFKNIKKSPKIRALRFTNDTRLVFVNQF